VRLGLWNIQAVTSDSTLAPRRANRIILCVGYVANTADWVTVDWMWKYLQIVSTSTVKWRWLLLLRRLITVPVTASHCCPCYSVSLLSMIQCLIIVPSVPWRGRGGTLLWFVLCSDSKPGPPEFKSVYRDVRRTTAIHVRTLGLVALQLHYNLLLCQMADSF
jgi:hypothetical protein